MAYDEGLGERIREVLRDRHDVVEKKMFGGLCFMVRGHMTVGINGDELMVRVGKERYDDAMAQDHAREMDFTGRSLKGFVYVSTAGFASDSDLRQWVGRGLENAESLPAK